MLWQSFDGDGPHLLEIRNRHERNLASSGYKLRFKSLTVDGEYDQLSRLTEARYNPGVNVDAADGDLLRRYQYSHDLTGNRLSESVAIAGGAPTVTNFTYNAANQIADMGFTYDDNGNLTSDGTNAYTWDRANRLLSMGDAYDGDGGDDTKKPI
jgi:hypothetical protein